METREINKNGAIIFCSVDEIEMLNAALREFMSRLDDGEMKSLTFHDRDEYKILSNEIRNTYRRIVGHAKPN